MRKLFTLLLYLVCIVGIAFVVIYKRDWVQNVALNKIEGMYYVYKGDRAYRYHKHSYAIDYYRKGLELYPEHYSAWHNLGNIYVAYEDFYAAVDAYEQAIKHNDKYVVARMNLGIILAEKLGNFDAAIEQYEAIINKKYLNITIPFVYSNKKSSKVNKGLAYYNIGRAYRQKALYLPNEEKGLSNQYMLKSVEAYKNACKILKNNSDARYNLALGYHILEDYREAGKNYCKAIKLSPMNYEAHYNMAVLLRHLKYYKASLEELEKAALLISTAKGSVNSDYIFGILSEVTRTYSDFKYDPLYLQQFEDNDNQSVDFVEENHQKYVETQMKKQKNKKKQKSKKEIADTDWVYVNNQGKIAPNSDIDKILKQNMSECAGYKYFKDFSHGY